MSFLLPSSGQIWFCIQTNLCSLAPRVFKCSLQPVGTTASGISQDSRSYDNNMSSKTTSSSFVSDDEVRYFKQTAGFQICREVTGQSGFRPDCPVLGRTVRFFKALFGRPAQHQAGCVFVLLFETPPPDIGPPAAHRSMVCYDHARTPPLPVGRRSGVCYYRAHLPPLRRP